MLNESGLHQLNSQDSTSGARRSVRPCRLEGLFSELDRNSSRNARISSLSPHGFNYKSKLGLNPAKVTIRLSTQSIFNATDTAPVTRRGSDAAPLPPSPAAGGTVSRPWRHHGPGQIGRGVSLRRRQDQGR